MKTIKLVLPFIFMVLCLSNMQLHAQQKVFKGDPDEAFKVARELAFNKKRAQAQDSLLLILTKYPTYNDVRAFLASTYSWDGNYAKARKEFAIVLKNDSDRKNTWIAAINNELWSESPFKALELVQKGLHYFPKDADLLYLKASAEENSKNPEEALATLNTILKENPENEKAKNYKLKLNNILSYNAIGIKSSVDLYSKVFDPMQYYLLKYTRQTKYGSIISKINFNRRFNENGMQVEFDLYPKIAKGLYAYLNVGFANTFLFPDVRYGAELYKSLPKSFEASVGFRALKYSSTTTIYTGSVGWYTGNSYLSIRTYITPGDSGTSKSGTFTYRKYGSDADNYIGISVGMGFSPEINQFKFGGQEEAIIQLNSQKLKGGYYFTSSNKQNLWGINAGFSHQEISFDQGNYFWIYSLGISYQIKFR